MSRRFTIRPEGLPDIPAMMLATIEALKEIGGSAHIKELDEKVIELEGLSEEEQALPMKNDDPRLRVNYYLAWARTYLRRGDAIENSSRGIWSITPRGMQITTLAETKKIHKRVNEEEREKARPRRAEKSEDADSKAGKLMTTRHESAVVDLFDASGQELDETAGWKELLLNTIREMSADAFERLSQRLLREAGFTKVEVRGKTGDGGIDGVGVLRVNLVSFQVYFQCKKWKGSVGAKEIRDFRGALQGRADKGLFITTGTFTGQASDEATRDGAIAIDLIDGDRLCELLKENRLGVSVAIVEEVRIDQAWFEEI